MSRTMGSTVDIMQSPAFDKLVRVLTAEREDGCRDRIVMGGLERFLAVWTREVRVSRQGDHKASPAPGQDALVTQVTSCLQDYALKPVTERIAVVGRTLRMLSHEDQRSLPKAHGQVQHRATQHGPTKGRSLQSKPGSKAQAKAEKPDLQLGSAVTALPGVASALARMLGQLGVQTIKDLLYLFPRRYEDFTRLRTISQLCYGEEATIIGVVDTARNDQTPKRVRLTKAIISDGTGTIEATWFNQQYLVQQLRPGRRIALGGRVDEYRGRLAFESPAWEAWTGEFVHTGRLVPVYPLTEGLTGRRLRALMKPAVERWAPYLIECLPVALRQSHDLIDLTTAVRQIHFPDDKASLERARYRLCLEELLLIQLGVLSQRFAWQQQPGKAMTVDQAAQDGFVRALPFALTSAQQRVLGEIAADLRQSHPMSRLLQGDVGSGKTVVALAAMLVAVANDTQAVIMAPTEVLAEQHYRTLTGTLEAVAGKLRDQDVASASFVSRARVGLLTGSLSEDEKEERRREIATGEINIVVGTHALIQEGVSFRELGLAIVDEQHRFGVSERAALRQKGYNPHVLVMSATPIPRTLALTIYGDLDISVIDELPPHRQKIMTSWLEPRDRERAYAFVREQIQGGRQAFIICPLIEESEKVAARAAVTEYRQLQDKVFPDLRLGLLHGRMKSTDKDEVMAGFRAGELDVLVSTAVVEVGIDVPNATVMLVEGADRFGLAQLHQFRGRVGRGEHQSYCLLLADSPSEGGEQRLKVIETTDDGFLLAEEDLKMRGPGEFFGTRQAGLPDLKVAQLSDLRVLEQARKAALELFRVDPSLSLPEHQLLAQEMREFWQAEIDLS